MEQGQSSNEFHTWSTDILDLRHQINEIFCSNNQIYGDKQCVAFKSLVHSTAEYVQLWADSFQEEAKLATPVGKELLRILKRGMELLHCVDEGSAESIFILLGSGGEFSDIVDAIRRYSQMILHAVKSYSITNPDKPQLLEKLERTIKLDCNMHQNALISLSAATSAYEPYNKKWLQSLKDRLACSKGVLDEKGISSFIEILERGIIADSDLNVQKCLGNGSYGTVHKALCLGIPVAVKEFFYNDHFDIEYKLFKELMGINSSHIVQILGYSVKSCGRKALVMEVMDMDLRRLIEIKKESNPTSPFSVYEATDIMLQVASGLRELHRIDVIHRDIKPSNILVSIKKDGSFVVKLADFGASKTNFQSQYTYTDRRGTMLYMAPEMENERGKYTRTVDAYSFGVVYVEILTGSIRKEKLKKHKLPSLLEGIPSGLSKIICRCLEQEAKKRPSFKDICNDLWDVTERLLMAETDQHYLDEKTELKIRRWHILNLLPKLPHWKADNLVAIQSNVRYPLSSMDNKSSGGLALEDLMSATAEAMDKGRFGTAYKVRLKSDGSELLVKRLKNPNISDLKEFKQNIELIRKLNHPNIVKLREYFFSEDEQLLVYDYVPNGSLHSLMLGILRRPHWETSLRIALDCAHGLSYIHDEYGAHGYITSSNVFLDEKGNACISDLGLALAFPPAVSTPEQDVYSFGVFLLLEILTGRVQKPGAESELPTWVQSVNKKEWMTAVSDVGKDVVETMLWLALDCVDALERRPKMCLVVQMMSDLEVRARVARDRANTHLFDGDPFRHFVNFWESHATDRRTNSSFTGTKFFLKELIL